MTRYCIYTINSKDEIEIVSEAKKLCPRLSSLSDAQLKFIISGYDYIHGPFCEMPKEQRISRALNLYYKGKKSQKEIEEDMWDYISDYLSLIYDPLKDAEDSYKTQIARLSKKIREADVSDEKEAKRLKEYSSLLKALKSDHDDVQKQILKAEEKMELKGDKRLSFIEQLKANRRLYEISNNINVKQEWIRRAEGS